MNRQKIKLLYLLGAGRSGTTLLATLLHSHSKIFTLGEMNQFYAHLQDQKNCSCGEGLSTCPVWKPVRDELQLNETEIDEAAKITEQTEKHSNIPRELLFKKTNSSYLSFQERVFKTVQNQHKNSWLLDSSKYVARYLALKKSKTIQMKGIYVVRDVRGVVNSFQKKVQTPKKPLAAILYYNLINFWAQIVCWCDKTVLKIRYEDLTENPKVTLAKIYNHIFDENNSVDKFPEEFEMPHIIGGNRMKTTQKIKVKKDVAWKNNFLKKNKTIYYIFAFPFMLINKYKI